VKKLIWILMTVMLSVALTGCRTASSSDKPFQQENTPKTDDITSIYREFERVRYTTKWVDSIETVVKFSCLETYVKFDALSDGKTTAEASVEFNVKQVTSPQKGLSAHIKMIWNEEPMEMFYKEGYAYTEDFGVDGKTKTEMDKSDFESTFYSDVIHFPKSAVKSASMTKQDGDKILNFILDATEINDFMWNAIASGFYSEYSSTSVGDMILKAVFNEDYILKSYSWQVNISQKYSWSADERNGKMKLSFDVISVNDVVIDFPADLDEYRFARLTTPTVKEEPGIARSLVCEMIGHFL